MTFSYKTHRFTNFLLFGLAAIAVNLLMGYIAGYATAYSNSVYVTGSLLLVSFIILHNAGYEFTAKLLSTIFFNAFFFVFTQYHGLRSLVFIYYFPFLVSHVYMFKDSATKVEARIFIYTCMAFIIAEFIICPMEGKSILTPEQQMIMYKKNFIVAFALSAYYFNAIFGYLILQTKLAQEASASKARFLSIMSHELRTPLNGIISSVNLMAMTTDETEKENYNMIVKSSSEHLLQLVNNVLDYSKASSGKMELNPVACSIESLLLSLQAVFQSRFAEKGLLLELLVDEEIKKFVFLDDIRFVQVITNLISNALKFTEVGKAVVAARCAGIKDAKMEVEVSVTDTGIGLSDDQQEKIFDLFNNVDNKSRQVESSGLGLSISKMIVEMMGGSLSVESGANNGSRFYFTFTVPLAPAAEKIVTDTINDPSALEGTTILIAEDNPINMLVARGFLKKWKVNILEATDGVEAQQILIQKPGIDLLLLDLQMPEMNGYELMQWIKESELRLPVLAFTAQLMENKEKIALYQLGFMDMIPKPFAPEDLLQKIKTALASKKQVDIVYQ